MDRKDEMSGGTMHTIAFRVGGAPATLWAEIGYGAGNFGVTLFPLAQLPAYVSEAKACRTGDCGD